ncbi:MAG: hypothetical protein HPY52_01525 [Firmicutes bacterium]|nr:hypothetical protein [Bacillota bacterium]
MAITTIEKLLLASILISLVGLLQMSCGLLMWHTTERSGRLVIILAKIMIITFLIYIFLAARLAVGVFFNVVRAV